MSARKHHEFWIEQCEAARTIKTRYGLKAAFDYVVGEKLINFASAASQHPEFGGELPRFVCEVRRMSTAEEIRTDLARLEREQGERAVDVLEEEDELYPESRIAASERVRQFTTIKEVLTASELGTS
jgi:hypothetical protein